MDAIKTKAKRRATVANIPIVAAWNREKQFVLELSWPRAEWMDALNPHAKGHWRGKAKPTALLRDLIWDRSQNIGPNRPWSHATITYRFYYPSNIQRDEANMIQRMKPVIDGLVDAGIIIGDHWQVLSTAGVVSAIDKANPRIEIIIESKENA